MAEKIRRRRLEKTRFLQLKKMEFRIFRVFLFAALLKMSEGMTEQEVLNSLAEKVSSATKRNCTAPTMPQSGSAFGKNCGTSFRINVTNGHITTLFDLDILPHLS